MKTLRYILFLVWIPVVAVAQDEEEVEESPVFIGINGGIDNNVNAYKFNNNSNGNSFYGKSTQFNIGMDVSVMISKKLRPRLEFKFVKLGYGAYWDNTEQKTTFTKTTINLSNLDLNLRLDYLLLSGNKFQTFISPALKLEWVSGTSIENTKINGSTSSSNYFDIAGEHPRSIAGGAISIIFKYNISSKVGIVLSPEYTMFFRNFVRDNSKTYQRFSGNIGFEFQLFR